MNASGNVTIATSSVTAPKNVTIASSNGTYTQNDSTVAAAKDDTTITAKGKVTVKKTSGTSKVEAGHDVNITSQTSDVEIANSTVTAGKDAAVDSNGHIDGDLTLTARPWAV